MKSFVLLFVLSIILAACPNNCNSHGKCNNGVCECFRSVGLETIPAYSSGSNTLTYNTESYYGPDCSRKMCPYGISYASLGQTGYKIDVNDGTSLTTNEVVTPTAVADRRMQDLLVQGEKDKPKPSAAGFGVPPNHMYVECSGAGICDSEKGICECFDGYEGPACQRMACPNQCSGKGKCVAINEAVGVTADVEKFANLFGFNGRVNGETPGKQNLPSDAEAKFFGCLCDKGFRGSDCSLRECPSGTDPESATNKIKSDKSPDLISEQRDCSGRGNCNYETGECKCFDGFSGASCSTMSTFM